MLARPAARCATAQAGAGATTAHRLPAYVRPHQYRPHSCYYYYTRSVSSSAAAAAAATAELSLRWRKLGQLPHSAAGHVLVRPPPVHVQDQSTSDSSSHSSPPMFAVVAPGRVGVARADMTFQSAGSGLAKSFKEAAAMGGVGGRAVMIDTKRPIPPWGATRVLDLGAGTCTKLQNAGPCPLQSFKAAVVDDVVYCIGEDYHDLITEGPLSVVRCNLSAGDDAQWEKISVTGDLPPRRKDIAVASVDHEIFVMVKSDDDTFDTYIFDTQINDWVFGQVAGDVPQAVKNASLTLIEVDGRKKVVLHGGTLFAENILLRAHSDDVNVLDTESLTWHTVAVHGEKPAGRSDHAALATAPSKMVMYGGKSEITTFRDVFQLDVAVNSQ